MASKMFCSVMFCFTVMYLSLYPHQTMANNPEAVKGVDLAKYMGRWYEIASFPSFFQPKNGENTRATYTLNKDGTVHVLNEVWNNGKRNFIEGTAYKADPKSDEAKLKVKFYVPPILPIIPVTGDYWILSLDQNYQYALIGGPTNLFLWVSNLRVPSIFFISFNQNCVFGVQH
jgi:lipocalin